MTTFQAMKAYQGPKVWGGRRGNTLGRFPVKFLRDFQADRRDAERARFMQAVRAGLIVKGVTK